ncbi:hypothetical protein CO610_06540 [Lysobacteraceae bacterium NML95-0200]|nr:hypothetical protein CO610_06540 [Xanthomonadaceae bacterium NML95-0200]
MKNHARLSNIMNTRDYRRFSRVAQARFRPLAEQLGYTPFGSTRFARLHPAGWHEVFWLHSGCPDEDAFSVYYGIAATALYPSQPPLPLQQAPVLLHQVLRNSAGASGFGCASRAQVSTSAQAIAQLYRQQALPWFARFTRWQDITSEYAQRQNQWLSQTQPDQHDTFAAPQAFYGLLLLKTGQPDAAHRWLQQSRRLLLGSEKRENWQEALLQDITRALNKLTTSKH